MNIAIPNLREGLLEVGKRRKAAIRKGRRIVIVTRTGKGIEVRIGTVKRIVTVLTEIVIGIEVGSGVRGGFGEEIGMVLFITEVETMTDEGIMIETVTTTIGLVLVQGKSISGFDMAPPASAMLAAGFGAATVAAAAAVRRQWREPTYVAFYTRRNQCTGLMVLFVFLLATIAFLGSLAIQIPGTNPALPGVFPNKFPLATGQFGALPLMPIQAMTQQATRHARLFYVGGLSPAENEQSVATFFSHVMAAIGGNTAGPGDAVNVHINHEKKFAFVEMRSVKEASNAMALDGIIFEGAPVKVRRPSDYNPSLAATLGPSQSSPNLNLAAVGLISGFCWRANHGATQPKPEQESILQHAQQQIALQRLILQPQGVPTKVVCLTQALGENDLRDDEEYEDIVEDMRQEGGKHGALVKVVIPMVNHYQVLGRYFWSTQMLKVPVKPKLCNEW
ncbi:hypothetical protein REPUB_Repub17cG0001200 [Reevesia pubescens]